MVRQGSLAAARPRRRIKMTPAAVAAAAFSDSEGSAGRPASGDRTGAVARQSADSSPTGATVTKKRVRPAKSSSIESAPDDAAETVGMDSSSEFSQSEAVTRRRGKRQNGASRSASATAAGSTGGGGMGKRKAGAAAAAVRRGRSSKEIPGISGAAGESGRPVFEDTRSKYRGVTRHRRSGRWEAHIWIKELGRWGHRV